MTNDYYGYIPRLKARGFAPQPLKAGIPLYADSVRNPKCEGTTAHEQWWEEQINYCIKGYWTGGTFIPGRYYYYLNFCYITSLNRGNHHPDFVDADLEYFEAVEEVKKPDSPYGGIISLKARRRGLSEKWAKGIAGWGLRFTPEGYKAGIVAGLQTFSDGLFDKVRLNNSLMPPELRLHNLSDTKEDFVAGYEVPAANGFVRDGSMNTVICKTAATNANVLKGNFFNDVAFEESGEFLLLKQTRNATKSCLQIGGETYGTEYLYGTGGNIQSSSKEFSEIWHDHEKYRLLRLRVYSPRIYMGCFIGSTKPDGTTPDDCPNIKKQFPLTEYSYEQLLGMEDVVQADKYVSAEVSRLLSGRDKELAYSYMQENARNDKEAFRKFTGSPFDHAILSAQEHEISIRVSPNYERYLLHFEKDEQGGIKFPLKIGRVEKAPDNLEDHECILVRYPPVTGYKDLYVQGTDSYDQDQSHTSKSLGASVVLIGDVNDAKFDRRVVACLVRQRPHRKEIFWENCLKVSVWYDVRSDSLSGNNMIDFAKPGIIEYYKRMGCKKYLAIRPRSFEAEDSTQTHDYGMQLTNSPKSKSAFIGQLQTWVLDYAHTCWFPQLIQEFQDYDITQKVSDWDAVDALGFALARLYDMKKKPREAAKATDIDPYAIRTWEDNGNGVMVAKNNGILKTANGQTITDPFTRYVLTGSFE